MSEDAEGIEEEGRRRECPVPKPTGLIGQVMGFGSEERAHKVVIKSLGESERRRKKKEEEEEVE